MTAPARREQAVQLRLAGLSRSQIADAMGLRSGGQALSRWLRGVPPPEWTRRPRAKDDLRAQAVAMRKEGRSYREIRDVVGVSKSTLSLWLRDVPLTEEQQQALTRRGPEAPPPVPTPTASSPPAGGPTSRPRLEPRSPS